MTHWQAAMMILLPFLAAGSPFHLWRVRLPWGAKLRAWVGLMGSGIAAHLIGYPDGIAPEVLWAVLDGLAALVILWPPKAEAQRAIGLLFIAMMMANLGFYVAGWMQPGPRDYTGIVQFEALLGWLQWARLLSWGVGDALEGLVRRAGPSRRAAFAADGV